MVRHTRASHWKVLRLVVVLNVLLGLLLTSSSGPVVRAQADNPEEHDPRGEEQPQPSPAWFSTGTELHLPGDGQPRPPVWSPGQQVTMHDGRDQVARLELVIKRIIVHDDQDVGEGELRFTIRFWVINDGCSPDRPDAGCFTELARSTAISFNADDTEWVLLDRVFPGAGDTVVNDSIGPGIGIPIYASQAYGWEIRGVEVDDVTSDDTLGWLVGQINGGNGWGPPGSYIERGTRLETGPIGAQFSLRPAHFSVQYEIRHAALPDLRPASIRVDEPPDARQPRLCATFQNDGPSPAEAAQIVLAVDGATISTSALEGLAPGESRERCDWAPPFVAGRHTLAASVDAVRAIPETNESNNELQQEYVRTIADDVRPPGGPGAPAGGVESSQPPGGPIATAATPVPSPAPTRPTPASSIANVDLAVRAITPKGNDRRGRSGCTPGDHDVTVVVKNHGSVSASSFAVSLVLDDDDPQQKNVPGLDAGQEVEVRFAAVRLTKGEHELTAMADAQKRVAETDEGNNGLTVKTRCKDDD